MNGPPRRAPYDGDRPSHPPMKAMVLMIAVVLLIVLLAVVSSFSG